LNGAHLGADDTVPCSQPDAQFSNPQQWSTMVDTALLQRLFECWRRCFVRNRSKRPLIRLFRSLEVAFHAGLFPADGLGSINDIGTRLALWVSALEVLCHPTIRSVNKRDVQKMLRSVPFDRRELVANRYTISFEKKRLRVSLPEAAYDDLYWARNQFLHGMPVSQTTLHYRQSKGRQPLVRIAPVLYNLALLAFLQREGIPGGPITEFPDEVGRLPAYMRTREGLQAVQSALAALVSEP
jgi:hypothetical protein